MNKRYIDFVPQKSQVGNVKSRTVILPGGESVAEQKPSGIAAKKISGTVRVTKKVNKPAVQTTQKKIAKASAPGKVAKATAPGKAVKTVAQKRVVKTAAARKNVGMVEPTKMTSGLETREVAKTIAPGKIERKGAVRKAPVAGLGAGAERRSGFVIENANNLAKKTNVKSARDSENFVENNVNAAKLSNSLAAQKTAATPAEDLESAVASIFAPKRSASPFIKTEVNKRPLSGDVFPKKAAARANEAKEPASDPIRVVDAVPKGSHSGLVIAIILTVLLGAVAGTVAFLAIQQ